MKNCQFWQMVCESLARKMESITAIDAAPVGLKQRVLTYMQYKCSKGELKGIQQAAFHLNCSTRQLQRILNQYEAAGIVIKTGKGTYKLRKGVQAGWQNRETKPNNMNSGEEEISASLELLCVKKGYWQGACGTGIGENNMASKVEFVKYVADQLSEAGTVTYRKMFGEYGMYLDGKIFALICNDQLYIKTTEAGKRLMPELEMAPPYQGAKNYFLFEEIDNIKLLNEFVRATWEELPMPKPKKPFN